jgi:hypothetical protein
MENAAGQNEESVEEKSNDGVPGLLLLANKEASYELHTDLIHQMAPRQKSICASFTASPEPELRGNSEAATMTLPQHPPTFSSIGLPLDCSEIVERVKQKPCTMPPKVNYSSVQV